MAKEEIPALSLNVQAIRDYQVCSLFYDYRYQKKLIEPMQAQKILADRFQNVLTRVIAFYFYKKQTGFTPSYNALINRWERLWFPKDMEPYDLLIEQHGTVHGNLADYSVIAAAGLLKMYEDFSEMNTAPLLIDESFTVPMDKDIQFTGKIDLALRKGDDYAVYMWSTQRRRPALSSLAMEFAGVKYAFDYRTRGRFKKVRYFLYDFASSNPGIIEMQEEDIPVDALEFWAKQIKMADRFVPRRGLTAYCKGCVFDEPCRQWDEWSK
jgi:hypothetical protein